MSLQLTKRLILGYQVVVGVAVLGIAFLASLSKVQVLVLGMASYSFITSK
jgi:hypothetical protein